jgi:hypothetical protein
MTMGVSPNISPTPVFEGVGAGGGRAGKSKGRAIARGANVGEDCEGARPAGASANGR